nr:L-serine ammonia-lyase, iron-sulfur-dependent, subunit alpha [Nitratireductor sp.]
MFLSVFDLYKIGIGPSSSHTMGPMVAAARFLEEIATGDWPRPQGAQVAGIAVSLHGSLAYTGIGHATDRAVILGLAGERPDTIDPDKMDAMVEQVKREKRVAPTGHPAYRFDPATDLLMDRKRPLPGHANGMEFSAFDAAKRLLLRRVYYSIGGGFVVDEHELAASKATKKSARPSGVPYPFSTAAEMLTMARRSGLSIAAMKRANEEAHMPREALDAKLDAVWDAMRGCIERGITQDGTLPGGLKVRRRAHSIHDKLKDEWKQNRHNPLL